MKIHAEAMITMSLLFLGAGQRIFLAIIRVQKNRKGSANLPEALIQHLAWCSANHHPIPFRCLKPQERIPDRTTNQVAFAGFQRRG
jgi:hypothetical protein